MSEVLSQEEIDALLTGISDGEIETEQEEEVHEPSDVQPYDLIGHDRVVYEKMPIVETTAKKFARGFRTTLSSLLRRTVDISMLYVDMVKYEDFIKAISVPASLHLFQMKPLSGSSLIGFEPQLVFALVDIIFGGSGRTKFKVEGRDFTTIENNLIKRVVSSALTDFQKAWETIVKLDASYQKSETNPQFAQIMASNDVAIVIKFEVDLEFSSGAMTLCIPYLSVKPFEKKLQAGHENDRLEVDKEWEGRLNEGLRCSDVGLIVELGRTELRGREIVSLKKGDVVILDQYCSDSLDGYVENILKFKGRPGLSRGNLAVEISKFVEG